MKARPVLALALASGLLVAACGSDEENAAPDTADEAPVGVLYEPVSDVEAHAAIGGDIEAIKAQIDRAKEGAAIDWDAVEDLFTSGGSSRKADGSIRTLQSLVDAPDEVGFIHAAIEGTSPGLLDAVRAQHVDKGISVLLAAKVFDELAAARTRVLARETDARDGAPHNVDEAWAFFTADGFGLASTADKRADDFNLAGHVKEPVLQALVRAQSAALEGAIESFDAAVIDARAAVNVLFYLATYKYLETGGDDVRRAEGLAFYRGIQPVVMETDGDLDATIVAAFTEDDPDTGRAALNDDAVLEALGIPDAVRQD